jgi:hypothetical protein
MSVVSIHGRDVTSEARALLHCVLRDGDVVGTDDAGRSALLPMVDPWTFDRLLAFDADATDLEDTDGESEPDEEVDGPATAVDIVPPKRLGDASRIAQALALVLLLVTVSYAAARSDQAPAHDAAVLKRGSADAVLPEATKLEGFMTRLDGTTVVVRIPMRFQRRGGRMRIVAPDGSEIAAAMKPEPDGTLVKALARAWRWQRLLDKGVYTSVTEISEAEDIGKSYVSRILRLALLAPSIVEEILDGRADNALTLEQPLPAAWADQMRLVREHAARAGG